MSAAKRRDNLVTLQRATSVSDAYGEEIETWNELGKEWAAIFYGTGNERRDAARLEAEQAATFNVLSNEMTRSLTVRDRIVFGGDEWNITSTNPVGRSEVDLVAKRAG